MRKVSPESLGDLFRTGRWGKQEVAELVLGTVFSFLSWSSVFCIQQLPISRGTLSTLVAGSGRGKAPLQCASFPPPPFDLLLRGTMPSAHRHASSSSSSPGKAGTEGVLSSAT